MSSGAHVAVAAAIAGATAYPAARVAIRVARATDFMDRPTGYKGHKRPTPYLGGAAVMLAILIAALVGDVDTGHLGTLLGGAGGLWLVGTIDDRRTLSPQLRILVGLIAATAVGASDLGWEFTGSSFADFALTTLWVVGLINAFNLMDNLDGAAASVTAASGVGIAALALANGHDGIAMLGAAVSGACLGFLPLNLAKPARIFLGDGGSMPLGYLVATLSIAAVHHGGVGVEALVAGCLLAGLPILDMTLVVVSRKRRGLSVVTAGRDHLTHRLLSRLNTPLRVAAALSAVQLSVALLALLSTRSDVVAIAVVGATMLLAAIAAIALLESPRWRAEQFAMAERTAPQHLAPRRRASRFVTAPVVAAAEAHADEPAAAALESR